MIGDGMDIIVSETRFERTEGLYMWGRSGSGGYSPNCRVQFLDNSVLEGNHLWNYNGSYPYGYEPLGPASKTAEPFWMGVPGGGQGPGCPFQGAINHIGIDRVIADHGEAGFTEARAQIPGERFRILTGELERHRFEVLVGKNDIGHVGLFSAPSQAREVAMS